MAIAVYHTLLSSVSLLVCSFFSVPALSFLFTFDKAALYHTVPFILNSVFSNRGKLATVIANSDSHSQKH